MRLETRFITAAVLAAAAFTMDGGVHAAEQAVKAEEVQSKPPKEASIPFVNQGGIRDWQAIDNETLYIQDIHRKWYLAKLMTPCIDLPFVQAIGIETKGVNRLDKWGSIIVRGQRYPIASLVASGPPPSNAKRAKADKDKKDE